MGNNVRWPDRNYFDSDAFALQFDSSGDEDSTESDETSLTAGGQSDGVGGTNNWYLSGDDQSNSRNDVEVIHGSYYSDGNHDSESTSGAGTDQSRSAETVDASERRERERLSRARTTSGRLSSRVAKRDGAGDRERWIDERNREAVALAIQTLRLERQSSIGLIPSSTGVVTPVIESSASIIQLPQASWPGVSFHGSLWRLYLNNNGEWIVQFKGRFEDQGEIARLGEASGMLLKIQVDEV